MWQKRMWLESHKQCQLIIPMSKQIFLLLICYSKVSQRKISPKSRSDKCVHCEAKVELEKLKEFVTCKGKNRLQITLLNCFNLEWNRFRFQVAKSSPAIIKSVPNSSSNSECGNAPGARRIGETFHFGCFVIVHFIMQRFRVIQQRAGEWLLKQLNQAKNSDGSVKLTKEALSTLDGETW